MPSSRSTKPWPPASTTPASRSTASFSGVVANDLCAALRARLNSLRISRTPCSTPSTIASPKSSSTVGMVPATGLDMADQAAAAPALEAAASWRASSSCATRVRRLDLSRCPTLLRVNIRLVPVSPSGTGNTLMRLSRSRRDWTFAMPEISAYWSCSGSMRISADVTLIGRTPFHASIAASVETGQFTNLGGSERPGDLLAGVLIAHDRNLVAIALNQLEIVVDIDDLDLVGQAADGNQLVGFLAELARLSGVEQQSHRIPSG